MQEIFAVIEEFPDYVINNYGCVMNSRGQVMTHSPVQGGDLTVGLMLNGRQRRRSVKVLVARAFVPGETPVFDTPIQLDGNRHNLCADNLRWRPRWHAINYGMQFDHQQDWWFAGPVTDITTNTEYPDILTAAMCTGSLISHIRTSLFNDNKVFPEGGIFQFS